MDAIDQARIGLTNGRTALVLRLAATTDVAEKAAIAHAISDLNDQMQELNAAELGAATAAVAAATAALERCIAAAKVGPFGEFLSTIGNAVSQLQAAQGQMLSAGAPAAPAAPPAAPVPPVAAPAPPVAAPTAPVAPPTAPAAAPLAQLPPINPSTEFADLRAEYQAYFDACVPDPAHSGDVRFVISQLQKNRPRYEAIGADLLIPWYFIGLLHCMECSFSFQLHLHNGDPLTARTVNEPRGHPQTGSPPFRWEVSARDALTFKHFDHQTDWSVPQILYRLETNNGFGYRRLGLPSPYLWSFSNLQRPGKFTSDNKFDPTAPSDQCGAGVALRVLHTTGVV